MTDARDSEPDSAVTPLQPALSRVSTAHLSFAVQVREIVERLENRRTMAALALVPEGARLLAAFEAWSAAPEPPPVAERNPFFAAALGWLQASRIVLGDSSPAAGR